MKTVIWRCPIDTTKISIGVIRESGTIDEFFRKDVTSNINYLLGEFVIDAICECDPGEMREIKLTAEIGEKVERTGK